MSEYFCNLLEIQSCKKEYSDALVEGDFQKFENVFFKGWAVVQNYNLVDKYFLTEDNKQTICCMINSIFQAEKKTSNRISLLLLGPKSVGKTFLLRSLLNVSKILSPNLVSAYYSIADLETDEDVFSLLKKEYTTHEKYEMKLYGKDVSNIGDLIQYFHLNGKIPFIIVDEIDLLYKAPKEFCRKTVAQLHKIGDTKGCLGWVTGSQFVTRSVVFQYTDEIPQGYYNDMPSLNNTKYTPYWLTGIDKKAELEAFLSFKGKSVDNLEQIYKSTGGIFGKIESLLDGKKKQAQDILSRSRWTSLHWEVIACLCDHFHKTEDVWEIRTIPKQTLVTKLQERGFLKQWSELNVIVDSGLLIDDSDVFKIGNFEIYFFASALKDYAPRNIPLMLPRVDKFLKSLLDDKIDEFVSCVNDVLRSIPYDASKNVYSYEEYYHSVIHACLFFISSKEIKFLSEPQINAGRIDVWVETPKSQYICELKTSKNSADAMKQIDEKGYARDFPPWVTGKPKFKVSIVCNLCNTTTHTLVVKEVNRYE